MFAVMDNRYGDTSDCIKPNRESNQRVDYWWTRRETQIKSKSKKWSKENKNKTKIKDELQNQLEFRSQTLITRCDSQTHRVLAELHWTEGRQ